MNGSPDSNITVFSDGTDTIRINYNIMFWSNGPTGFIVFEKLGGQGDNIVDTNVIGNLSDLYTTNKSNIVDALNEAAKPNPKRMGYDLCVSTYPTMVYRDKFLTSGLNNTTINAANIPYIFANVDKAEATLPYYIQELTTFFKNLDNDPQYDQLIGEIPSIFGIPYGSWGVAPSSGTDMDIPISFSNGATINFTIESFELIIGTNKARSEIYTFKFTFAQVANTYSDASSLRPFNLIYQTSRNFNSNFSGSSMTGGVKGLRPYCNIRPSSFTTADYDTNAFPLMYEPITLEIDK